MVVGSIAGLAKLAGLVSTAMEVASTLNEATEIWRRGNRLMEQVRAEDRDPTDAELDQFRTSIEDRGAEIDAMNLGGGPEMPAEDDLGE